MHIQVSQHCHYHCCHNAVLIFPLTALCSFSLSQHCAHRCLTAVGFLLCSHASSKDTRVLGGPGICSPRTILKFEVLKLLEIHWNGQSYHDHIILYHFKSFMIPSGGPFWLLGGACTTHAPPCPWAWCWLRCKQSCFLVCPLFAVN